MLVLEVLQGLHPLGLRAIAVNRRRIEAVPHELVLESIRALESYEDIANAEAESAAIRRAQKG